MGNSVGRRVLPDTIGRGIDLSADGNPVVKSGGITVDWSTVAAVTGSPVTEPDGIVIDVGKKYLRCGQVMVKITASGKYGPHDPAAGDGREVVNATKRGQVYLIRRTIVEDADNSELPPGVMEGGLVFKARLRATAGAASLAAGPTYANLELALPLLRYAQQ